MRREIYRDYPAHATAGVTSRLRLHAAPRLSLRPLVAAERRSITPGIHNLWPCPFAVLKELSLELGPAVRRYGDNITHRSTVMAALGGWASAMTVEKFESIRFQAEPLRRSSGPTRSLRSIARKVSCVRSASSTISLSPAISWKTGNPTTSGLGSIVRNGRAAGLVNWDGIEDRTRHVRTHPAWDGPTDIIDSAE
jgi:hypothetical protein